MVLTGQDISILVGVAGVSLAIATVIYKFVDKLGELGREMKSQGERQDKVEQRLAPGIVTIPMCTQKQGMCVESVCKKVEEVKATVNDLRSSIDANDKIVSNELADIKHFMGRIEGLIEAQAFIKRKDSETEETRG